MASVVFFFTYFVHYFTFFTTQPHLWAVIGCFVWQQSEAVAGQNGAKQDVAQIIER